MHYRLVSDVCVCWWPKLPEEMNVDRSFSSSETAFWLRRAWRIFFGDREPIMSQDILNMKLVIYSVARSEFFHLRLLRTIEGFLFLKRVFCFSTALNKMYNYSEKGSKSEGISLASLHEYYFFYENQFAYCIKSRNIFFVGRDQTKDWEIFIKILLNGQMCLDMIMFAEGWLRNWWN